MKNENGLPYTDFEMANRHLFNRCVALYLMQVTSLPGFAGALPSTHYSGYLPVGKLSGTLFVEILEAHQASFSLLILW